MNLNAILDSMEPRKNHRWTGRSYGAMAVLLGFKRPADDDDTGMWTHRYAGSFHDDRIPAIVDNALANYFKFAQTGDMVLTVSRINQTIGPMLKTLIDERREDEYGPIEAADAVDEIIEALRTVIKQCQQLLVDEDLQH